MTREFVIRWDECRQNWPGRLAWIEARVAEGTATAAELAERQRLLLAREQGSLTVTFED
jgi:hypothetical protein